MLSMQNTAVTASFMTIGMMETGHGRGIDDIYRVWNQGGIELHCQLCQYAELSERIVVVITTYIELDFPGVYDYEVSEPFGTWFAEHIFANKGRAPDSEVAKAKLLADACQFFSQSHSPKAADCLKLIEKVTEHL